MHLSPSGFKLQPDVGFFFVFMYFKFYFVLGYSFRWIVEGLSRTCMCIHSPPNSPPILAATWPWAEFPVLPSRALLVLHVKHSRVSMSIPDSLTIPSPTLPPGDHQVITECWTESPVLDSRSLLVIHFKYSSVSMSIPKSLTIPPPILSPWEPSGYYRVLSRLPWAGQQVLAGSPC